MNRWKMLLWILSALACFSDPGAAAAETSIFAGPSFSVGDLGGETSPGRHIGACVLTPLLASPALGPGVEVGLIVDYHRWGLEDGAFGRSDVDGHLRQLEILGAVRIGLIRGLHLLAGFGLSRIGGEIASADIDGGDDYTWVLGLGRSFSRLRIDAAYHSVDVGDDELPADIGWSLLSLSVGVAF